MMYWQQKEIDFVVIEMRRYVRDIKLWKTPEKSIETPWKIDFRNEEHLSAGFHAAVQNLEKNVKSLWEYLMKSYAPSSKYSKLFQLFEIVRNLIQLLLILDVFVL